MILNCIISEQALLIPNIYLTDGVDSGFVGYTTAVGVDEWVWVLMWVWVCLRAILALLNQQ